MSLVPCGAAHPTFQRERVRLVQCVSGASVRDSRDAAYQPVPSRGATHCTGYYTSSTAAQYVLLVRVATPHLSTRGPTGGKSDRTWRVVLLRTVVPTQS